MANRTPIADYAAIGDRDTVALIARNGSIDWLCLPRFDSPACFAALLGTRDNGRWLLGPADDPGTVRTSRRYLGDTFALETTHVTSTGTLVVTDFMPITDNRADLVRIAECTEGTVTISHDWTVRTGYGKVRPWVSREVDRTGAPVIAAVAGPDLLTLHGTRLPKAHGRHHVDEFTLDAGSRESFVLTWCRSHKPAPGQPDVDEALATSRADWQAWADRATYDGPYRAAVLRSLLTLRLLTHRKLGGIVAAPTTSLPEDFGGERNWDYRFCWLRDASLTLSALLASGYTEETADWRAWLVRAVAGDPDDLQIMYAVDGGRELPERTLDHLPGYADSRPVRVGNAAVDQQQTDVLGEVMMALSAGRHRGLEETRRSWAIQRSLIEQLCDRWNEPDNGLWEIRGERRHFTHSRVMVWAALDRAVDAVEEFGLPADVGRWRAVREEVYQEVLSRGWNQAANTFTQHYDTTEVDASLLLIPACGFLPGNDPRVLATIAAIERDLMCEGLVLRYRTASGVDGLGGEEHPFLACSFWLVEAYAGADRLADAQALMDQLCALANDVGLLSEEYDPTSGLMAGNMPQAFSHLTLIHAAYAIEARRRFQV